jgi:hypothetical protein
MSNKKQGLAAVVATAQPLDWRAHIPVHPAANEFPLLSEKELRELAGDIKRNGLRVEIALWRPDDKTAPVLLDGRNRVDALAMLGQFALNAAGELCIKGPDDSLLQITQAPKFSVITCGDPETLVYSLNLHRRHLTPEQKRELIARLIKATPEKSDRAIGKMAKVSKNTAASVRRELEGRGQIDHVETRTDTKGRKQPAKKKAVGVNSKARKQPAKRETAKPKRSASQDQRELEAKQAHIDEPEAARKDDQDLAEQLQAAKIKIIGLETEVEELKAANEKLRDQLEAAQKVAA